LYLELQLYFYLNSFYFCKGKWSGNVMLTSSLLQLIKQSSHGACLIKFLDPARAAREHMGPAWRASAWL
jgi:hypothetical protein